MHRHGFQCPEGYYAIVDKAGKGWCRRDEKPSCQCVVASLSPVVQTETKVWTQKVMYFTAAADCCL